MAKIFITGSSDGLGLIASKILMTQGHQLVLHARDQKRKQDIEKVIKGSVEIVTGDLSNLEETKQLASQVNALGKFDAVIQNAGVYNASAKETLNVNVLSPYILTCLIEKPKRVIYLSSAMHLSGKANFKNIDALNYSDSKLYIVMLCKALAKKWPDVYTNAVNPGWVPTKMGGKGAPDDLQKGAETQAWLAVSEDASAKVSGNYFFHKKQNRCSPEADDADLQNSLLDLCKEKTSIPLQN
jgi:NAD(P)-dependent dehydrogenase (short-subunit alcohol dehydrogenase family)